MFEAQCSGVSGKVRGRHSDHGRRNEKQRSVETGSNFASAKPRANVTCATRASHGQHLCSRRVSNRLLHLHYLDSACSIPFYSSPSLFASRAPGSARSGVASPSLSGTDTLDPASASASPADVAARLNAEKVRILLRANDELKKQVLKVQRETKDNVRVKRIKRLEAEVEEKQVVFEAFKARLAAAGDTPDDIQAMVAKAIGGPARIRPPSVEELQAQVARLELEKLKMEKKMRSAAANGGTNTAAAATAGSGASAAMASSMTKAGGTASTSTSLGSTGGGGGSSAGPMSLVECAMQLEIARTERDETRRVLEATRAMLENAQDAARLQKMCVLPLP